MDSIPIRDLYFELTHLCNQKCNHCYIDCNSKIKLSAELTTKEIFSMLDDYYAQGGKYVVITGGEPFTRRDCLEILDYIDSKGIWYTIASNSLQITDEQLEHLAVHENMICYFTSILGKDAQSHAKTSNNARSFGKALHTIDYLTNKGKFVFIQATLIKSNLNQIWDIAKLICKYPNTKLKITPFTNPGAKVIYDKNEIVGKELYNAFLTTIDELKAEYKELIEDSNISNYKMIEEQIQENKKYSPYMIGNGFLAIRPDGTKSFSTLTQNPFTFGNAKDNLAMIIRLVA